MSNQNEAKALKKLYESLIDARNGYREGIKRAERPTVVTFFERFEMLHGRHIGEIDGLIRAKGLTPPEDGSWMTFLHEGIMKFRSAIGTLDRDVRNDVLDGEQKLIEFYDETIGKITIDTNAKQVLEKQKSALQQAIDTSEPTSAAA